MPNAIVLGAGMMGSVIAADLAADDDFDVTIADIEPDALARAAARARGSIATVRADLADPAALTRTIQPFDVVVGALASHLGHAALRTVIDAGKSYCDISFMPENALDLDERAKAAGVTAIVDCGVAPGMSNLLAGYGASHLDECRSIEIYVGGLPMRRRWPFQYKAAFSPRDVIEEYTRPARLVEHARVVEREALSEPQLIDFPRVGTLEAFNTDGLRSLADTLDVPFMKEKTLRYPGHIELMRVFRHTGLFSSEPVRVGDASVRPIDLISKLMFPLWTYDEGEPDLTVMRVIVEGTKDARPTRLTWDLHDEFDPATGRTSMARTTAFPCAILARLVADGSISTRGVVPPELLGPLPGVMDRVLEALAARGVVYTHAIESL